MKENKMDNRAIIFGFLLLAGVGEFRLVPKAFADQKCMTSVISKQSLTATNEYSNPGRQACLDWFQASGMDSQLTTEAIDSLKSQFQQENSHIKSAQHCGPNASTGSQISLVDAEIREKHICTADDMQSKPQSFYIGTGVGKRVCCYSVPKCDEIAPAP